MEKEVSGKCAGDSDIFISGLCGGCFSVHKTFLLPVKSEIS